MIEGQQAVSDRTTLLADVGLFSADEFVGG